jgi:hypothetical protein
MTTDKDVRDLTRAINRLHDVNSRLYDVVESLNANLVKIEQNKPGARQAERNEKFLNGGDCNEYLCSQNSPHLHGPHCGDVCPCVKVRANRNEEAVENAKENTALVSICHRCFAHLCRPDGTSLIGSNCQCCKNNHVVD